MNNMRLGMRIRALVSGLALMFAAFQVLAASEVQSVRLWRAPDNTRLVFDLSGPVEHKVFTLTAPKRIVIDVEGGNASKPFEQLALENTPISGLRSGKFDNNTLRLVIDLKAQVSSKSFTLPPNQQYGHRLVVDRSAQEAASPATPSVTPPPQTPATPVPPTPPAIKPPPLPGSKRDIVLAIDAGPGGEDPGAISPGKVHEKNVVL